MERQAQVSRSGAKSRPQEFVRRRRWLRWAFPLVGFAALAWFLVRVIPKPSRATYPCQRAAFPVASAFVLWLAGVFGGGLALHRLKQLLRRSRVAAASAALLVGVLCAALTVGVSSLTWLSGATIYVTGGGTATAADRNYDRTQDHPGQAQYLGVGKGVYPGRVVLVRDTSAVTWDGSTGYWSGYPNSYTNNVVQAKANAMMEDAVMWLTGETTASAAWDALFKHRNGNGLGYQAGEKICIKLNMVTMIGSKNGNGTTDDRQYYSVDRNGDQISQYEYVANSRELVLALFNQLVNVVGVAEEDIYIGDPTGLFPNLEYTYLHDAFPNVHYMTRAPLPGREEWRDMWVDWDATYDNQSADADPYAYQDPDHELLFSGEDNDGPHLPYSGSHEHDYPPLQYQQAKYFINFAVLKSHNPAFTLCGKNNYGSIRIPNHNGYFDLHDSLPYATLHQDLQQYRCLVDLMGHKDLGGKTLLYLIDGLFAGYRQAGVSPPVKYRMWKGPSSPEWPALLLASQDPVAIDSVGFDILWEEGDVSWDYAPYNGASGGDAHLTRVKAGDDYLHEAALADAAPSGTVYDPERDGVPLGSLGVHEHWTKLGDFATAWQERYKYSRNLGTGYGIELIVAQPKIAGRHIFYNNSAWDGNDAGANANDDNAIAPDKMALRPGGTASSLNYTSYSRGINGIMVDLTDIGGTIDASDFEFRAGNDTGDPASWALVTATPSVTVRAGAGVNGSDRVTITFPDGAIAKKWLRVKVLANADTGLDAPDVHYWGNAIGETCNNPDNACVTPEDEVCVRNNPHTLAVNPASITDVCDFNRDKKVTPTDAILCRNNGTSQGSGALELITP